ncbi:TPA: hypothetical protein ACS7ZY_002402 [Providencia alcalifaciens]
MSLEHCNLTFENFWGEELKRVLITTDPFFMPRPTFLIILDDIKDKSVNQNAARFIYESNEVHYWLVSFLDSSGTIWTSQPAFKCQITKEDNHSVTLGLNGESKHLYAAFPSSSSCSTDVYIETQTLDTFKNIRNLLNS